MPKLPFSKDGSEALFIACDFLLHCKGFSLETVKACREDIETVMDALIDETEHFSHGEINALFAATVLALRFLYGEGHLADGVPADLISRLSSCKLPLEQQLSLLQQMAFPLRR